MYDVTIIVAGVEGNFDDGSGNAYAFTRIFRLDLEQTNVQLPDGFTPKDSIEMFIDHIKAYDGVIHIETLVGKEIE